MTDKRREARPIDATTLEAQAAISPEDLERAKVAAEQDGSPLLNAMLHALPDEGQP